MPKRKNLGAGVERGGHKDYVTVETLENSESWTGNKAIERTETLRW